MRGKARQGRSRRSLAWGLPGSLDQRYYLTAIFNLSVATILKQEADQIAHGFKVGGVVNFPLVPGLRHKIDIEGKTIAIVAPGGNVDTASFCAALSAAAGLEQGKDRDGT